MSGVLSGGTLVLEGDQLDTQLPTTLTKTESRHASARDMDDDLRGRRRAC